MSSMLFLKQLFYNYRHVIFYGIFMAGMIFLLKWLQWKYLITDYSVEVYIGLIAILFTALGIWIALQLVSTETKTVIVEKEVYGSTNLQYQPDMAVIEKLNLTNREFEVLNLITRGLSNAEIAKELSLSQSTIKTHASNLYSKLDVKRRTQAIEKAKRLGITP